MAEKDKGEKGLVVFNFAKILARKHGSQILNPFEGQLKLSERKGYLYKIKGKYAISGAGYVHLNRIASVNLITPQEVSVDQRTYPNPHVERNPTTKAIETVNIRKMAIGFSPVGNIVAIDKTLFYNVYTYFIQAIQAKMKAVDWNSKKPKYPDCAIYGTRRDKPDKDGKWIFFETIKPLGIWIDYTHEAIIACLEDHTQRQRFGDRIAQKIAERNCLKDHPAIGVSMVPVYFTDDDKKKENAIADVSVYGWRHELDAKSISDISEQAEKADGRIKTEASVVEAEVVEEEEAVKETAEEAVEEAPKEKTPAEMDSPEEDPNYEK